MANNTYGILSAPSKNWTKAAPEKWPKNKRINIKERREELLSQQMLKIQHIINVQSKSFCQSNCKN